MAIFWPLQVQLTCTGGKKSKKYLFLDSGIFVWLLNFGNNFTFAGFLLRGINEVSRVCDVTVHFSRVRVVCIRNHEVFD